MQLKVTLLLLLFVVTARHTWHRHLKVSCDLKKFEVIRPHKN